MKIHGREIRFKRTIWANFEILKLAPEGDIGRLNDEILGSDNYITSQTASAKFISILSEAFEQAQKYEDPEYQMKPLMADEALSLEPEIFEALFREALSAWVGEKPTVASTPRKNAKKKE